MSNTLAEQPATVNDDDSPFGSTDGYDLNKQINLYAYPGRMMAFIGNSEQEINVPGFQKREVFAMNAPEEIPTWFEHVRPEPRPKQPPTWDSLETEGHRIAALDWLNDGADLPEELQWFQDAHRNYEKDSTEWRFRNDESRYFQWRLYYADKMINALNSQP